MPEQPPLDEVLAPSQARDTRFTVRTTWAELVNHPDGTDDYRREFLHRQMNEEANVMENAAQSLVDFPDADWKIRMWLARQCSDEARHVLLYRRLMEPRGVKIGEYPVLNFQYRLLKTIDTLIGRLAIQNRTFEADGLDAVTFGVEESRARGEHELASLFDAQQADEIVHVGFANEWIHRTVKEKPFMAMHMARALANAADLFARVFAHGGTNVTKYPVAEQERREAGFQESEVQVAAEQSRARRAAIAAASKSGG